MHFDSGHIAQRRRQAGVVAIVVDGGSWHDQVADNLWRVGVQAEEAFRYSTLASYEIVDQLETKMMKLKNLSCINQIIWPKVELAVERRPTNQYDMNSTNDGWRSIFVSFS